MCTISLMGTEVRTYHPKFMLRYDPSLRSSAAAPLSSVHARLSSSGRVLSGPESLGRARRRSQILTRSDSQLSGRDSFWVDVSGVIILGDIQAFFQLLCKSFKTSRLQANLPSYLYGRLSQYWFEKIFDGVYLDYSLISELCAKVSKKYRMTELGMPYPFLQLVSFLDRCHRCECRPEVLPRLLTAGINFARKSLLCSSLVQEDRTCGYHTFDFDVSWVVQNQIRLSAVLELQDWCVQRPPSIRVIQPGVFKMPAADAQT